MGVTASTSKMLLKKIDKHTISKRHQTCVKNMKTAEEEVMKKAFSVQTNRFEELHMSNIAATEKVFRGAYLCAKKNLSFAKHSDIIDSHKMNGADMGTLLYSPISCHDIIIHITKAMKSQLVDTLIRSGTEFSIIVDESTTVSTK